MNKTFLLLLLLLAFSNAMMMGIAGRSMRRARANSRSNRPVYIEEMVKTDGPIEETVKNKDKEQPNVNEMSVNPKFKPN